MGSNDLWSVRAINKDDDTLIPETLGASVFSLSPETAWKGVRIKLPLTDSRWKDWIAEAVSVFIHLVDGGKTREHWEIKVKSVYDIKVVGDNLIFSVEGNFKMMPSEGAGSDALDACSG